MDSTITREEFDALAVRLAVVERHEARFDELRDLILRLRDFMGERHVELVQRFDRLAEQQITEDHWLAEMTSLRRSSPTCARRSIRRPEAPPYVPASAATTGAKASMSSPPTMT